MSSNRSALRDVLVGVVAALLTAAVMWLLGWFDRLPQSVRIPKGTVAAFNLANCPDGWSEMPELYGRVVVGVGSGEGLSPRALGEAGGAEATSLRGDHLPRHDHGLVGRFDATHHQAGAGDYPAPWGTSPGNHVWSSGSDSPSPVGTMPPFHALRYCQKD